MVQQFTLAQGEKKILDFSKWYLLCANTTSNSYSVRDTLHSIKIPVWNKFQKFLMPSGIRVNGKHSRFYHTRANFGQTISNDWLLLVAVEENVPQSNLLITWQQVWNKKQMDCLVNSNTELGQVNITWHSADSNLIQILYNTHKPQDMFLSEWLPDVFSHFWYGTA